MRPRSHRMSRRLHAAAALAAGLVVSALAGCRGDRSNEPPRQFFPSLDDQPKYQVQEHSEFFPDGRTMRNPPAGTVAFGWTYALDYGSSPDERREAEHRISIERAGLLRESDALYRGVNSEAAYLERMPIRDVLGLGDGETVEPEMVQPLIRKGQERFNIYCIVCHGGVGDGQGAVGIRWNGIVPSFHDPKYQRGGEKGQDGFLFHTILNGVPNPAGVLPAMKMPSYAEKISTHEAWAIVAYLRSLQESWSADFEDLPEIKRQELMSRKPPAPTASAAPSTGEEATQ